MRPQPIERRFEPDVLDVFVASGVSDTPDLRATTITGLSGAMKGSEADLAARHIVPSLFLEAFLCRKPTIYIHSASSRARNDLLVEHPQTTIVCQYDLSRFAGIDVMKACCSHPGVVYRKRLYPGYYASSDA